jgi:hypothetical protein
MKIIYNVTVNIDYAVCEKWLLWMKSTHIPEMLKTGKFIEAKLSKIMAEESGGASYSIQYLCENMSEYNKYVAEHSEIMQSEHNAKFQGKFVAFRTILKVEESFTAI